MAILLPRLHGSVAETCSAVAIAWPLLVGLGLLGVGAGMVALGWEYRRTKA